jgi:uncharacterized protein YndB with AHSA1/START domain
VGAATNALWPPPMAIASKSAGTRSSYPNYRTASLGRSDGMPTSKRFMTVPPRAVWDALADPAGYAYWVVGSKVIRDADPQWPAPRSRFHHTIGVGPITVSDHTEVLEARPAELLKLRAKGRPLGTAQVTLHLFPRHGGTLVRMTEQTDGVFAPLDWNPLFRLLTKGRNAESLMRLEELALRRAG